VKLPNPYAKLLPLSMCISFRFVFSKCINIGFFLFSPFDKNDKEILWIFFSLGLVLHTEPSLNIIPSRAIANFNYNHIHKSKLLPDTKSSGEFFEVVNCVLY
jgi:hypothetical protein